PLCDRRVLHARRGPRRSRLARPGARGAAAGMSSGAVAARTRVAKPNGWWGMLLFVATEATLFGTIFGTYYYLRFTNAHWPPRGVPEPSATVPLVLAFVVAATSVPMWMASRAARGGALVVARRALMLALVVQAGFFAMQVSLISDDLDKFKPQGSAYGSIYFTMLGAHEAH